MGAENSFVDWATIGGGIAGLISAVFVAYEKLTKGSKIICEIRKATYDDGSQGNYFQVVFDIGNVGSEMTTLRKVFLEIDELSYKKQSYDIQDVSGKFSLQIDDHRTQPILPGEAFVLSYRFYRESKEAKIKDRELPGQLRLELLNHSDLVVPLTLKEKFLKKEKGNT